MTERLDRLDAALKLGLKLFVCEDEKCQGLVQQKHCVWAEIFGAEAQIFCSMKCGYTFAKNFDGIITLFDTEVESHWILLGGRRAMSEHFVLTTAGLARLEQDDGRG